MPGRPQYIHPGSARVPMPEIDESDVNGAIVGLHRAVLEVLEKELYTDFLSSPEAGQMNANLSFRSHPGHDMQDERDGAASLQASSNASDSNPTSESAAATTRESVMSFSLVKINDRGRRQNRTLALSVSGIDSLRGDSVRFSYATKQIHGIKLDLQDPTRFQLVCYHYYDWECESEAKRFMVCQALESLGLGVVDPPSITAITPTAKKMPSKPPSMADFEQIKVIGRGVVGKVTKVKHRETGRIYAMKQLKVPHLIKIKQVDRARIEVEILKTLNHPFLVRLHYSFLDDSNQLCMALDYAAGGDLFHHLRKARGGKLHHMPAGFYVAEMICALKYLHNHDIVHRDLKPENILMGADGHLLLTDFGLSKPGVDAVSGSAEDANTNRAKSFVGTKEYVAPEVVKRDNYGKAVDWWAVGILFYELLVGRTPFEGLPGHIFDHIVKGEVKFPPAVNVPEEAVSLIMGLLELNPDKRLTVDKIVAHPFFTQVMHMNWDSLEDKDLPPPIRPQIQSDRPSDTSNFPNRYAHERVDSFVAAEPRLDPAAAAGFNFTSPLVSSNSDSEQ
eukprot:TRINITY_DN5324_c0_g1_i2.p1 TRINITY_DN5324_c0_g1~~TRINITY_DN5324_c0_g1_i2.p1  ORF type:complete len:562 (+),score=140.95 TRINITY_DN5324_c0_g1_i2:121-1806(+)